MPCLNEIQALHWLLPRIPSGLDVIVVDNGSCDGSADYARSRGVHVIEHREPREAGRCVELGVSAALTDVVCVMDCDGTIDPCDIIPLIQQITLDRVDFVVGARLVGPSGRRRGPLLTSRIRDSWARRATPGWFFPDLGSVRAFRRSALYSAGRSFHPQFAWNLDITLYAAEQLPRARLGWIAVPYRDRLGRSKIAGSFFGRPRAARQHALLLASISWTRFAGRVVRTRARRPGWAAHGATSSGW
ncbi:glycosyltransferase family 2 protein [Protaetiibacter intestinalis]|uniref:Glycosyltransferase family 2 protein n=1 Tax=Protaetiibacter intestinalis TaxID=2419774 RepID=A0A387B2C2_9MICO|nr:glycosyltransferase family 2 protein [Protaetiibacter intestinalis]AYF97684.1 glycosyltransferase family 2 protein [Protaetiibacter intestinalis]